MIKLLWRCFWLPYALAHKHRGSSHWPILGTVVRILYVSIPFVITGVYFNIDLSQFPPAVWPFLAWAAVGVCVSDVAHIIMDTLARN